MTITKYIVRIRQRDVEKNFLIQHLLSLPYRKSHLFNSQLFFKISYSQLNTIFIVTITANKLKLIQC